MNEHWREFLQVRGATIDADGQLDFGDAIAEATAMQQVDTITACLHWGSVSATGADALKFLGAQLTSEIREFDDNHSQLTAWCNVKGRVVVNGRLLKTADACVFVMRRELLPGVLKRLRMYVLRSKLLLADASDSHILLGCTGPNSARMLSERFGALPESANAAVSVGPNVLVRLPGPLPRFLVCCTPDLAPTIWQDLSTRCLPVGTSAWELSEILSGTVLLDATSSEAYLPQMLQLEHFGGLSFSKGCYPGQEVITRLKYRGELKRQTYYAELQSAQIPAPATPVVLKATEGEREIGEVIAAAPLTADKTALLAVLEIAALDAPDRPSIGGTELRIINSVSQL
jgi:tRNA-modifying protein YgfZ